MEDTHTDLKKMVAKDSDTGNYENLGKIFDAQMRFQSQTLIRFGNLEGQIALLGDRIKLLLWVDAILFMAFVGALVKGSK
jgi:hypothetical protein